MVSPMRNAIHRIGANICYTLLLCGCYTSTIMWCGEGCASDRLCPKTGSQVGDLVRGIIAVLQKATNNIGFDCSCLLLRKTYSES
jgi:hypothetical protein